MRNEEWGMAVQIPSEFVLIKNKCIAMAAHSTHFIKEIRQDFFLHSSLLIPHSSLSNRFAIPGKSVAHNLPVNPTALPRMRMEPWSSRVKSMGGYLGFSDSSCRPFLT